jgi:hypothetical protein
MYPETALFTPASSLKTPSMHQKQPPAKIATEDGPEDDEEAPAAVTVADAIVADTFEFEAPVVTAKKTRRGNRPEMRKGSSTIECVQEYHREE